MSSQSDKADQLLQFFKHLPSLEVEKLRNNPKAVLDKIDQFSESHGMMTVGPQKGKIIIDKINSLKSPKIGIELGCFIGYSAILLSQTLSGKNSKFYTFEINPHFASIAKYFINLAGFENKIEIIIGSAAQNLVKFQDSINKNSSTFITPDFIFIDHWKDLYVPDLRVIETLNLISPGTLIFADNIYFPGAPEYVKYIQSSPQQRRAYIKTNENINGKKFPGRWNILYDSKTVEVGRDAVEITTVTDYLNG